MRKFYWVLAIATIILWQSATASARGDLLCEARETVEGHDTYNGLLCAGIAADDSGRYEEAVAAFKKALDQFLFEYPNFELLPRLALAYQKSGARRLAEEYLAESELTFSVYFGILECKEENNVYWLADHFGHRVKHPLAERTMNRMCGAILEHIYRPATLARIAFNCRLYESLRAAQLAINGE
jgi:tetratricopeptide (TPR) repeat protein